MSKDYYGILGVSKTSSDEEIKKAYRNLAKKHHPDVNPGNKAAEEKFKDINEAYAVLGDKIKRGQYDQMGHSGFKSRYDYQDIFSGFRPDEDIFGSYFRNSGRGKRGGGGFSFESGDMGSFFETFFGGRPQSGSQQRRGQDYEYEMTVDFLTAVRGGEREISFDKGSGPERVRVKVPSGIKDGQKIRLKGKGGAGYGGAQGGDLYIKVTASNHPYFRREGNDLYVDVPVTISEAILGAKVTVPTIDGQASMNIPPGTSGGQKLRLKGKGVKSKGATGDQYVVIRIVTPKKLDDDSRKLMEKFAEKNRSNPREGLF